MTEKDPFQGVGPRARRGCAPARSRVLPLDTAACAVTPAPSSRPYCRWAALGPSSRPRSAARPGCRPEPPSCAATRRHSDDGTTGTPGGRHAAAQGPGRHRDDELRRVCPFFVLIVNDAYVVTLGGNRPEGYGP